MVQRREEGTLKLWRPALRACALCVAACVVATSVGAQQNVWAASADEAPSRDANSVGGAPSGKAARSSDAAPSRDANSVGGAPSGEATRSADAAPSRDANSVGGAPSGEAARPADASHSADEAGSDNEARPDDAGPSGEAMEEVEVTGERPGPNLWRVSNGDHVLWLMGTLDPLPKGMTWRSRELESVLKEVKQVVPSWPDVDVSAGPITLMRTWFTWRRIQKLPDKQTLKDWLPPDLHARWNALKIRYEVRGDSIDREVPVLAAMHLYRRALEVAKLAPARDVERTVLKLTRKNRVRITQTELKVKDPREVVTQLGEIPREIQVQCLAAIVGRLERDMDTIKAQADAWALGDVETLRKLPYPQEIPVCTNALATSGRMKDMIDHVNASWIRTIEGALTNGPPTLAVKPIYDLLGDNGVIARLRAKGYRIEGP